MILSRRLVGFIWLGCIVSGPGYVVGCGGECSDRGDVLHSGVYVIRDVRERMGDGDWAALRGAEVTIDRAARTAKIVYEREGTTYEVRYTLSE